MPSLTDDIAFTNEDNELIVKSYFSPHLVEHQSIYIVYMYII